MVNEGGIVKKYLNAAWAGGHEKEGVVVLCVQEAELDEMLEKALAAWRMPKWQWAIILGTVVFPILIQIRPIWSDPATVRGVILVGVAYLLFFLGTVVGRLLRPLPSQRDVHEFSTRLLARGGCVNSIQESRDIATQLGPVLGITSIKELDKSAAAAKFSVVDHTALLRINQGLQALMRSSSHEGSGSPFVLHLPTGTRAFYDSAKCAKCDRKLESSEINAACQSCGRPFCDMCARKIGSGPVGTSHGLLCESCARAQDDRG